MGDEMPLDPWKRRDEAAEGWEAARLLWRALDGLTSVEEVHAAVGAMDEDDLRFALLARALHDLAERGGAR